MVLDALLLITVLCFTVLAIFSKRLLLSAVSLGVVSLLLAVVLFVMEAPFAGGFELSIGAGLISILFIMTISLSRREERDK